MESVYVSDITDTKNGQRLSQEALKLLYDADITISDTETTGKIAGKLGLTEFASLRAVKAEPDNPDSAYRIELFKRFILPLRPEFSDIEQDWIDYCEAQREYKQKLKAYDTALARYEEKVATGKQAKKPGKPAPPDINKPYYDRSFYEYPIDTEALAVTGTEFIRAGYDGPIVGMRLKHEKDAQIISSQTYTITGEPIGDMPDDETVDGMCSSFYEVAYPAGQFTRRGVSDVYYNTPFDKPVLSALLQDVGAYELATDDAHLAHDDPDREDAGEGAHANTQQLDSLFEGMSREHAHLLEETYEEMDDVSRRILLNHARNALVPDPEYTNSAQYQCLFFSYMMAAGIGESNRLDDAYRKLVDPDFTERDEHSAEEDICMAAAVAAELIKRFDGNIPTMLGLYERLVKRVDPNAVIKQGAPREKDGNVINGDIIIQFSDDPQKLGDAAQKTWEFLHAFHEVTYRNSRVPKHLLKFDEAIHQVTINAERRQPLSLNFLKKWILFNQLLDSTVIDTFLPFDSTGNLIDVRLKQTNDEGNPIVIEDTHYGSLRANLEFIEAHPDMAQSVLNLVGAIRRYDRRVGVVLIRERPDGGYRITIRGHLRQFGSATIDLPDMPLDNMMTEIQPQLSRMLKLGVIPFAQDLQDASRDEGDVNYSDTLDNESEDPLDPRKTSDNRGGLSTHVKDNEMSIRVNKPLMQLICMQMRQSYDSLEQKPEFVTAQGYRLQVHYDVASDMFTLKGDEDAFWDFIYPNHPIDEIASDDSIELADKPSSLIRNSSWLMYRLQHIPGTFSVSIEGNMAVLHQQDGISLDALSILQRTGIPFKAYQTEIKMDVSQLMQDAFHWSQQIGRRQKEHMGYVDKPEHKTYREYAPKEYVKNIHRHLLSGALHAVEFDDMQQCWALDGSVTHVMINASPYPIDRHYKIDQSAFQNRNAAGADITYHKGTHQIHPCYSPISGKQHLRIQRDTDSDEVGVIMSDITYDLWCAHRKQKHKPIIEATSGGDGSRIDTQRTVTVRQQESESIIGEIERIAMLVYSIHGLSDVERLPLQRLERVNDEYIDLHLPPLSMFERPSIINDLIDLHHTLTDSDKRDALANLRKSLPLPEENPVRHSSLFALNSRVMDSIKPISQLEALLAEILYRSGGLEDADPARAVRYTQNMQTTLGVFGLLIHELAHDIKQLQQQASHDSVALQHAQQILMQVHAAREKIFRFATANERLDEQAITLVNALTGRFSKNAKGLKAAISDAFLHSLLCYLESGEVDLSSDESIQRDMNKYDEFLCQLFQSESIKELIPLSTYEKDALSILARLAMPEANERLSKQEQIHIANYLLKRAKPHWSDQQRQAVIRLYSEPDRDRVAEDIRNLFPEQKHKKNITDSGSFLLRQRDIIATREPPKEEYELTQAEQNEIDGIIKAAYRKRGDQYLIMANNEEPDSPKRQDYLAKCRHCYQRAALTDDNIGIKISLHVSPDSKKYARAQSYIEGVVPIDSKNFDDQQKAIDLEGREDRVRELFHTRCAKDHAKLYDPVRPPYEEFKQKKELLRNITKTLKEMHDMQMILFHGILDLSAAICQLNEHPEFQQAIPAELTDSIMMIGESISNRPHSHGLQTGAMKEVLDYRDTLTDRVRKNVLEHLTNRHIAYEQPSQDVVRVKTRDLLKLLQPVKERKPANTIHHSTLSHNRNSRIAARDYAHHLFEKLFHEHDGKAIPLTIHLDNPYSAEPNHSITLHRANAKEHRFLKKLFKDIDASAWGHQCILTSKGDELTLTIPSARLCPVSLLIDTTYRLSQLDCVQSIRFNRQTKGLRCEANIPSDNKKQSEYAGKIQLIGFGTPLSFERFVFPKKQGKRHMMARFDFAMDSSQLQSKPVERVAYGAIAKPATATREDVARAIDAFATQHGLGRKARKNMIDDAIQHNRPLGEIISTIPSYDVQTKVKETLHELGPTQYARSS